MPYLILCAVSKRVNAAHRKMTSKQGLASCFALIGLVLFLAGCTGKPVKYEQLESVQGEPDALLLTSMFGFVNNIGINKGEWNIFLSQGEYVARYKNNDGTFYQGPSRCARWVHRIKKKEKIYNCGLFRPKGNTDKLYLYTFKSKLDEIGFREYQASKYFIHKDDLGANFSNYIKEARSAGK
jgi:hypothetical protein